MARLLVQDFPFSRRYPESRFVGTKDLNLDKSANARPASARTISYRRSLCAQTTLASAHYAERFTANPERPARTPHALQEAEIRSWLPNRRGLLGFAGLASHIRPLLASIPSCSVPEAKILPTAYCCGIQTTVFRSYSYY